MADGKRTRRDVLRYTSATVSLGLANACVPSRAGPSAQPSAVAAAREVPRRPLGKTGAQVSILALGGSHLGDVKDESEAMRIVHEAMDHGVNFFDNAWEYHDGMSEERLGKALRGRRSQAFVMTKVCTHGRDAKVAMEQLEESLRRLGTDHLDLWQVHECVYDNDPEHHYAKGGVLEALDIAKRQGKVRFTGFTGHKSPDIHLDMLTRGYPFDTVQMPLNCFDATFESFEQRVLPEVTRRQLGAIGMKTLCGSGVPVLKGTVTADEAIRYALSLPVATIVSGIDSIDILRQNLAILHGFQPMNERERGELRARCAGIASDGRYELYKTTKHYDGKEGRQQHGYPTKEELPL